MALNEHDIELYWKLRSDKQGEKTVGFAGQPMKAQDEMYKYRWDFLKQHIPANVLNNDEVIEYGCGVGRYAQYFKRYLGLDITEKLIKFARKRNPDKLFVHIDLYEPIQTVECDTLFTATCLQHNNDESVGFIIDSLPAVITKFFIYENNAVASNTVQKRTTQDYYNLFKVKYNIEITKSVSHIVHNEEHVLSIFEVKK